MLEFVKENGVLCTIISSAFFGIIGFLIKSFIENRKSKKDTIKSLKKELAEVKEKLKKYTSIEQQEKFIEKKASGAIYVETMPNGNKRNICGYCWENNHTKMPLMMNSYYDDEERKTVVMGNCGSCKATCYDE